MAQHEIEAIQTLQVNGTQTGNTLTVASAELREGGREGGMEGWWEGWREGGRNGGRGGRD